MRAGQTERGAIERRTSVSLIACMSPGCGKEEEEEVEEEEEEEEEDVELVEEEPKEVPSSHCASARVCVKKPSKKRLVSKSVALSS